MGIRIPPFCQIDFHLLPIFSTPFLHLPPVCLVPGVETLFSSISTENKFPVSGQVDGARKIEIQLRCVHF